MLGGVRGSERWSEQQMFLLGKGSCGGGEGGGAKRVWGARLRRDNAAAAGGVRRGGLRVCLQQHVVQRGEVARDDLVAVELRLSRGGGGGRGE